MQDGRNTKYLTSSSHIDNRNNSNELTIFAWEQRAIGSMRKEGASDICSVILQ